VLWWHFSSHSPGIWDCVIGWVAHNVIWPPYTQGSWTSVIPVSPAASYWKRRAVTGLLWCRLNWINLHFQNTLCLLVLACHYMLNIPKSAGKTSSRGGLPDWPAHCWAKLGISFVTVPAFNWFFASCFLHKSPISNRQSRRLRWSSGQYAGLWNPSLRVQSRPKPLDFSCVVKILKHAFLRRGSKICVPCPSFAARKRT
jgi:hypothetical protein